MKVKHMGILVLCAVFLAAPFVEAKSFFEKKHSKIIEKTIKGGNRVLGKYVTVVLPLRKSGKQMDVIIGSVSAVPRDPDNKLSGMMVALRIDNETIILTNPDYVRTLDYLYFGRKVVLSGRWQKDAIIFGKKYRSFRVEDIKLNK